MSENEEVIVSDMGDAVLVTSISAMTKEKFNRALSSYDPENKLYSVYLNEGISPADSFTAAEIDELATNTQNDLTKVLRINAYNRKLVNKNDIVGKTVEAIQTNINTEIKLTYRKPDEGRNKKKRYDDSKVFIEEFNDSIFLNKFIRNGITTTFIEGNFISYLRHENVDNYKVDFYPLGVCEISEYNVNGEPVVLFNISELRSKLSKTYKKTKKNKALFFDKLDEEIKNNYPKEVYDAYKAGESYAVLDNKYTGVVRINNQNRRYGVSPIFRAYLDLAMLDTFADSDRINAKAKGKKIIHQIMRKETMGADYRKDYVSEMAYAHQNFMSAWAQSTVVVTSPPTVEEIKYVEPTVEMTSKDTYNTYRSKVLATLGIQFLMDSGSQTVSTANISVEQLMRTINSISEQFEDVLFKWYKQIMIDNGFDYKFAPKIRIIDSEILSAALKKEFSQYYYSVLNTSLDTAYDLVGLSVEDEAIKRKYEAEQGYDDLFTPRITAYTNNNGDGTIINLDNQGGRPADENTTDVNRQEMNQVYHEEESSE